LEFNLVQIFVKVAIKQIRFLLIELVEGFLNHWRKFRIRRF